VLVPDTRNPTVKPDAWVGAGAVAVGQTWMGSICGYKWHSPASGLLVLDEIELRTLHQLQWSQ
jgi:hypothetical protein